MPRTGFLDMNRTAASQAHHLVTGMNGLRASCTLMVVPWHFLKIPHGPSDPPRAYYAAPVLIFPKASQVKKGCTRRPERVHHWSLTGWDAICRGKSYSTKRPNFTNWPSVSRAKIKKKTSAAAKPRLFTSFMPSIWRRLWKVVLLKPRKARRVT